MIFLIRAMLIPICFGFVLLVYAFVVGLRQGYGWQEMDWDKDGHTSIFDVLAAGDIGKREAKWQDRSCFEYFEYKDGRRIKTDCRPLQESSL